MLKEASSRALEPQHKNIKGAWPCRALCKNQHFIHSQINRKPMKGLERGSNVGPPAGPSQKIYSYILYNF